MEYPKIHSLWKREEWYFEEGKKDGERHKKGAQSLIPGSYAIPEFGNIKKWLVQEKIDGTNIRIELCRDEGCVKYYGRTDNADIPVPLLNYLSDQFTFEKLEDIFPQNNVWLFGEGYGARIQKGGGNYRKDMGFILFDVVAGGTWLSQSSVQVIANKLNIPYAPIIDIMTEEEIVAYVKSKPLSLCSQDEQVMEGIIARPEPLVLLRNGEPLMMKLKCKEFKD